MRILQIKENKIFSMERRKVQSSWDEHLILWFSFAWFKRTNITNTDNENYLVTPYSVLFSQEKYNQDLKQLTT